MRFRAISFAPMATNRHLVDLAETSIARTQRISDVTPELTHQTARRAQRSAWTSCRSTLAAISAVAVAASAVILAAPALAATSHEFSTTFAGSGTNALSDPTDVAVDNSAGPSAHDIYVTDTANHRVEKFSTTGQFILMFGKEVNETKVKAAAATVEQNVCTAASGDICKAGTSASTPGAFESPTFVAVDSSSGLSSGAVYVGDTGDTLISKFNEEGKLTSNWGSGGELEGPPTETFSPLAGIAVDDTGKLFVYGTEERMFRFESTGTFSASFSTPPEYLSYGPQRGIAPNGIAVDSEDNLYKVDTPAVVAKLSESGTILNLSGCRSTWGCVWDGGEENATGLAIDPGTNDLYVDQGGGYVSHFNANCPLSQTNYYYSCIPADNFGSGHLTGARGISIDAASKIAYVADSGGNQIAVFVPYILPTITLTEPTNVERTSVTLNGHVDPGSGVGTEVVNCRFEYGYDTAYGLGSVPCAPAAHFTGATDVRANLPGLAQGIRYHYRLSAENIRGESFHTADAVISPAQEPTFEGVTATDVTATTATLAATINPNGRETTYHFDYGTTLSYGESSPEASIGSGTAAVPVKVHLEGLHRGLTYHFRLIATNSEGSNTSEDQTFGFYPSTCPNELLRQETGSSNLPDCRAYELVSPGQAGGAIVFTSDGPSSGEATNPPRLAFSGGWGLIPNSGGEPSDSYGDLYVSTRTDEGWGTKYIGLPSSKEYLTGGPPWASTDEMTYPGFWQAGVLANRSLSRVVDWSNGHPPFRGYYNGEYGEDASEAPYVWNTTTGALADRWPTDLGTIPGGEEFEGEPTASSDLSHFVFSSNVVFAPGGAPGDVYDDNTTTDQISIASQAEGKRIEGAEPLQLSSDGSHILMSVGGGLCRGDIQQVPLCGAGQLYMRIDDASTYEIAPGHVVDYLGMTAEGSKLYFTSNEQLIEGEETDSNAELYMWSQEGAEKGHPLTLISKPNGGADNTNSCNASWTSNCDAVPVNVTSQATSYAGLGGNGRSDSFIASESGDIYFYSPAQLDGTKGIEGGQNLYLYRNGQVQLVTTLTSEATRMDVSPDGGHMTFITASQITGYDNKGYTELYSFTPATGRVVCDSCAPNGESPTSNVYGSQNGLFMTDDGRAFFFTENALVPQDTNQAEDVYEFVDGRPQLITSGTGPSFIHYGVVGEQTIPGLIGVSANGTDVYFGTTEVLVGQDLNGQEMKIYDARTDGGIPFVSPTPPCAAADECHGSGNAPLAGPSNGTGAPLGSGGNAQLPAASIHHKKRILHKRKKAARHRRDHFHHRGGNR